MIKVYELMNMLSKCEAGADVNFYTSYGEEEFNMTLSEDIDNDEGIVTIFLNVVD